MKKFETLVDVEAGPKVSVGKLFNYGAISTRPPVEVRRRAERTRRQPMREHRGRIDESSEIGDGKDTNEV